MQAQRQHGNGDVIPALVTVIVAILGMAGIVFSDIGPSSGSQGSGHARMITAAAVSRAGAIETPSEPAAGQPLAVRRFVTSRTRPASLFATKTKEGVST
jgi:hypothetical protein